MFTWSLYDNRNDGYFDGYFAEYLFTKQGYIPFTHEKMTITIQIYFYPVRKQNNKNNKKRQSYQSY